ERSLWRHHWRHPRRSKADPVVKTDAKRTLRRQGTPRNGAPNPARLWPLHSHQLAPCTAPTPECDDAQGPVVLSGAIRIRMRSLDHYLYAWLAESDEYRFERSFNDYFAVAFPAIVRYLVRISGWDSARLEDLAQEALLRFFDRVGRGR